MHWQTAPSRLAPPAAAAATTTALDLLDCQVPVPKRTCQDDVRMPPPRCLPHIEPGSINEIIRRHPRERLYVRPLHWTSKHLHHLGCAFVATSSPAAFDRSFRKPCEGMRKRDMLMTIDEMLIPYLASAMAWMTYIKSPLYLGSRIIMMQEILRMHGLHHSRFASSTAATPILAYVDFDVIAKQRVKSIKYRTCNRPNPPVARMRKAKLASIQPSDMAHDPYIAAVLLALAQGRQRSTPSYLKGYDTQVFVLATKAQHVYLYTADMSVALLDRLNKPSQFSPSENITNSDRQRPNPITRTRVRRGTATGSPSPSAGRMARRHVPLRPALPREPHSAPEPTSGELEAKRRRVVVAIACDACRRKKIRCDGGRPACYTCRDSTTPCVYRDSNPIPAPANKLLVEVIQLMSNMPPEEVARVVHQLRDESDAKVILSVLRGGMNSKNRPSELSTAVALMDDSLQTVELTAQFPTAYPRLPRIPAESLRAGLYDELTRPSPKGSPLPQRRIAHPPLHRSDADAPKRSKRRRRSDDETLSPSLVDARLHELKVGLWTNVPIPDDVAARAISLYLKTDHPLMGPFDSRLFIRDLVELRNDYCSPLLVNAVLFWACQMYCTVDPSVESLPLQFCEQAESMWKSVVDSPAADSALNLAALQFLSLGYLGQGRDHAVLRYLAQAIQMGERMGLFGVDDDRAADVLETMSADAARNFVHAAWGVFNWVTLMAVFYHQPGVKCPRCPPRLPIPQGPSTPGTSDGTTDATNTEASSPDCGQLVSPPRHTDALFPHLCRFWTIMHEVAIVYYEQDVPLPDYMSAFRFSEYKFRELLAWSSDLPYDLLRSDDNPHFVQILHIWFHAAVLDIFRPYIKGQRYHLYRLRTFPSSISMPETIYAASVNQLKRLTIDYRLNYKSSAYTILWHTALIYVANAVLQEKNNNGGEGGLFFFLLCVYGYERLRRSWRVTESVTAGLLSMMLRKGDISGDMARRIMNDLQQKSLGDMPGKIRATFMVDLDLAMSDPKSATAENLASTFEENALFRDYTNEFEEAAPST
ncbi:N-terminal fungal transcription regulatory domain-containing protein [Paramyrothecium foliicola]|nr:N-terminal fungal transcription regulatory domain-containing protein [Paramyrothecium foliicola]